MLIALSKDLLIIATEASRDQAPFHCSECGAEVILKKGFWRIHHFAHRASQPHCDKDTESREHAELKLDIYNDAVAAGLKATMEHRIGERIADITIEGDTRKVAVEIQLSPTSRGELWNRTQNHNRGGYTVLWVVVLPEPLELTDQDEQYSVKALHKDIHELFGGVVFLYRGNLYFDVIHFMGLRYVTKRYYKRLSRDEKPLHLFKTVDETSQHGVTYIAPPESMRWWERLSERPSAHWD